MSIDFFQWDTARGEGEAWRMAKDARTTQMRACARHMAGIRYSSVWKMDNPLLLGLGISTRKIAPSGGESYFIGNALVVSVTRVGIFASLWRWVMGDGDGGRWRWRWVCSLMARWFPHPSQKHAHSSPFKSNRIKSNKLPLFKRNALLASSTSHSPCLVPHCSNTIHPSTVASFKNGESNDAPE